MLLTSSSNLSLFKIGSPDTALSYFESAVHTVLWILVIITFFLACCRDPGILKPEYDIMELLTNFHPNDICPRCKILTTPRSHHCNICDQCVQNWDHHCPWINNCVGLRNHGAFFLHLLFVTLLFGLYIEPPITAAISGDE